MNQEPTHIDATIAALEGWLERISTAIGTLKYFRSQGGSLPDMPPTGTRGSSSGEISHDAFFKMTVPDAAEKYLKLATKTKSTSDIAKSLLNGGLKSTSKDFTGMVKTVLSRDARFVRLDNKEWGLVEWYPGMRRGPRAATADTAVDAKSSDAIRTKPKEERKKYGFTPDSIKGKTLSLLDSKPTEVFTSKKATEALEIKHEPSVRAALCALFADRLIAKPETGKYQSLRG
jgi:hypothetical protein